VPERATADISTLLPQGDCFVFVLAMEHRLPREGDDFTKTDIEQA
jgi:uncharacterized protein with PIN domain